MFIYGPFLSELRRFEARCESGNWFIWDYNRDTYWPTGILWTEAIARETAAFLNGEKRS